MTGFMGKLDLGNELLDMFEETAKLHQQDEEKEKAICGAKEVEESVAPEASNLNAPLLSRRQDEQDYVEELENLSGSEDDYQESLPDPDVHGRENFLFSSSDVEDQDWSHGSYQNVPQVVRLNKGDLGIDGLSDPIRAVLRLLSDKDILPSFQMSETTTDIELELFYPGSSTEGSVGGKKGPSQGTESGRSRLDTPASSGPSNSATISAQSTTLPYQPPREEPKAEEVKSIQVQDWIKEELSIPTRKGGIVKTSLAKLKEEALRMDSKQTYKIPPYLEWKSEDSAYLKVSRLIQIVMKWRKGFTLVGQFDKSRLSA